MNNLNISGFRRRVAQSGLTAFVLVVCAMACAQGTWAATWHGIEPLKSRRADVERELGKPIREQQGATGALDFKVSGGVVTVNFVTPKFVETKKLSPELEGTVLLIVLQHDHSSDTPESMNLAKNGSFDRSDKDAMTVFYNAKDGITYTFINGRLKTTRYAAATDQLLRAQRN